MKKPIILGVAAVVVIAITAGIYTFSKNDFISPEEAQTKAENYINTNLLQDGSTVTLSDIEEENGLYKVKVEIGAGQQVDSYITKDGKLFFPQALTMDEEAAVAANNQNSTPAPVAQNIEKNDKPVVELFVMSYCPYGTQMEKGILPVVEALGDKIDFSIKFNDYAMHGEKEIDENLIQYCLQKEQPSRFANYLSCFLEDSQSASCLDSSGVDKTALNSCINKTDNEFNITNNLNNKIGFRGSYPGFDVQKADNAKYNVGGSPTLIINGADISSARDSASLLNTICSAFNEAPEECSTSLSSTSPSAGFGYGVGSAAAADCAQ